MKELDGGLQGLTNRERWKGAALLARVWGRSRTGRLVGKWSSPGAAALGDQVRRGAGGADGRAQAVRSSGEGVFRGSRLVQCQLVGGGAGVNYKPVWKHRMNDAVFAHGYDRGEEQAVARLRAEGWISKRKRRAMGEDREFDAAEVVPLAVAIAARPSPACRPARRTPANGRRAQRSTIALTPSRPRQM